MKKYIRKVILMLKENFTKYCAREGTKWITRMIGEEFEKKCNSEQDRGNIDVYKENNLGIYSKDSPWINKIDYHWISKIYIEQVNPSLTKNSEYGST